MIQTHQATNWHQDFRIQIDDKYLSFAIPKGVPTKPGETRLAVETEQHELDYLLEGSIVSGYGAGQILLYDVGEYTLKDPIESNKINFILDGVRLQGSYSLIKTNSNWLLIAHSVSASFTDDISVLTGRSMEEIAMNLPIKPQLCKMVAELPSGDEWIYEFKMDGVRLLAYNEHCEDYSTTTYPDITKTCSPTGPKLYTRTGTDITARYPHIAAAIAELPKGTILDGEAVVYDENKISGFQLLQNANGKSNVVFAVWDMPSASGTLLERKAQLKALLADNPVLQYVEHVDKPFDPCSLGLEGAVAKRADSLYQPNGRDNAVKFKCKNRQEFIVLGFTEGRGKRSNSIGALLLGYYDEQNNLRYAGKVGSGAFTAGAQGLFVELSSSKCVVPPNLPNPETLPKNASFVEPKAVVEVEFLGWTNDGKIRQGVYLGLREDKTPTDVHRETPELTHPSKLLFPEGGITKQGLADYFRSVEDRLVAEIKDRPLTLLRCPNGVEGTCFYQRNANPTSVPRGLKLVCSDNTCRYVLATADGLQSLANLNVVEIHPWNNKVGENPDRIIFDLDPSDGLPWERTVKAATDLRAVLQNMGLEPYVRTTGGTGLHVIVQIKPDHEPGVVRELAKDIAERMAAEAPALYTASPNMRSRTGKVYIDWLRNDQGSTSIASWSPRANSKGTVATPVRWEELSDLDPSLLTMATAAMKDNPWVDIAESILNPLLFTS